MTIEIKFFTSDGAAFDTRREANAHQKIVDCQGMLENLLAQIFAAHNMDDDPHRDMTIAAMLVQHKDDVINLLKGKPVESHLVSQSALEDQVETESAADADAVVELAVS
jgi:dsDNA-binding SOS-regulon protein